MSRPRHVQLGLADSDCLDDEPVEAERVEHVGDFARCGGEAAERSTSCHRPDKNSRIERNTLHSDAIAQQSATREWRRGIDGYYADLEPLIPKAFHQERCDGALPCARRTGQSYPSRPSRTPVQRAQDLLKTIAVILDDADDARERRGLPRVEVFEQTVRRHGQEYAPVGATLRKWCATLRRDGRIPERAAYREPRVSGSPPRLGRLAASRCRVRSPDKCRCLQSRRRASPAVPVRRI